MRKHQLLPLVIVAFAAASLAHAQTRSVTPAPNTGGSGLGSAATTPGSLGSSSIGTPPMATPSGIATNPSLGSPGMGLPPSSALGNPPPSSATTTPTFPATGFSTLPDTLLPGTLTTPGLSTLPGVTPENRSAAAGGSSPSRFCSAGSIYNPC
jgi:hypothetical protein